MRQFAKIDQSLLISLVSRMLPGNCHILHKSEGCQRGCTDFHFAYNSFKESKLKFISILLVLFVIPAHFHSCSLPITLKLMRFAIGKQTGNTFDKYYPAGTRRLGDVP